MRLVPFGGLATPPIASAGRSVDRRDEGSDLCGCLVYVSEGELQLLGLDLVGLLPGTGTRSSGGQGCVSRLSNTSMHASRTGERSSVRSRRSSRSIRSQ